MKTNTPTLSVAETDYLLRSELGPLRNWTHFLNDCIRKRQSIAGNVLLPCAMKHDGRLSRPMYGVADIKAFVVAVKAAVPSAGKARITPVVLCIDDGRSWRANRFGKDGSAIMPRRISSGSGSGIRAH